MTIDVRVQPGESAPPTVEYRWDADTDILTAAVQGRGKGEGMSGSVEIQGVDGSWLILDVNAGQIAGVEVAVWPEVTCQKSGGMIASSGAGGGEAAPGGTVNTSVRRSRRGARSGFAAHSATRARIASSPARRSSCTRT